MIVADTNVVAHLFLASEQSVLAERALQKDSEWAAPILWRSEFRSVLTLYLRKALLDLQQCQQIMNSASRLLRGREYETPSHEVLRLASISNCSAYDCEFVTVAMDLGVPLVTVDKQLLQEFSSVAVSLSSFSE
jgi:predicted nucleic acid-binding protein